MKDPEVHVHWRNPVSFRQVHGPIVRSNLDSLMVVEGGVKISEEEEGEEEGVTEDWGRDEGLRTQEFAIMLVMEFLELLVNRPISESYRSCHSQIPLQQVREAVSINLVTPLGNFKTC